jgi:hypothetical protein
MENITIEITEEQIRNSFKLGVEKLLKDDYGNPVKKALEEAINSKQGEIKKVVDEIIVSAISDPEFKEKIAQAVISKMVESALRK